MKKTIRMPKALLDKWLVALRSGQYKQCKGAMADGEGFCCLGVLVAVTGSDVNCHGGVPNDDWLEHQGITFYGDGGSSRACGNPHLPELNNSAAEANDFGAAFAEIADAIEACAEGY